MGGQSSSKFLKDASTAIEKDNISTLFSILQSNNKFINLALDEDGNTLLFKAITHSRHEQVGILIDFGADINLPLKNGRTPLMEAMEEKKEKIAGVLINRGARFDPKKVFFLAIRKGLRSVVISLLEGGVDLMSRDAAGECAMIAAVKHDNENIINIFIDYYKDIMLEDEIMYSKWEEDVFGALEISISKSKESVTVKLIDILSKSQLSKFLLRRGANIYKEKEDESLLCELCCENERNIILLPCAHFGLCNVCVLALKTKVCPFCKSHITTTQKVYKV
eukprot:TRINITY_DN881_c0_g1_i2.p1 TRINITY_DN881_c0_g1~~TRINITY_DN881_c0_g1_i2.p1  ORF type:complete len:279 (-),score=45.65 TRINITY_DN881_c0_g1_i2:79-915(-)